MKRFTKIRRVIGQARLSAVLVFAALVLQAAPVPAARASACDGGHTNPIITENCATSPKTWSSAWKVDRAHFVYDPAMLAGYASSPSVEHGNTLNLYVRAPAQSSEFKLEIYRLGWYGGAGGRLLQTFHRLRAPPQPACIWENAGTVDTYYTCSTWRVSYSLTVPTTWVSGVYVAVVTSVVTAPPPEPAGLPYQSHIVFVVRDDARPAEVLYQQAVATDEAYNNRFGSSIYTKTTINGYPVEIAKASFDRPFDVFDNMQLYRFELPFIYWLESQGYDVVYGTDLDMHAGHERLTSYKGVLTAGHSEYWSKQMYDAVQAARDKGINLGFFGGNTMVWQMRVEANMAPLGDASHSSDDRVMVVYRHRNPRNAAGLGDPNPDQLLQTILWRQFPLLRDEQALVGVHDTMSSCPSHIASWASPAQVPVANPPPTPSVPQRPPILRSDPQPLVVTNASNWVYSGTGLDDGDSVPLVYGQEADAFEPKTSAGACFGNIANPPPRTPAHRGNTFAVLSSSPFEAMRANKDGSFTREATHIPVNSVVYQACSGAWVFGAGSIMWANALAPSNILGKDYSSPAIQIMTANLLDAFSGRRPAPSSSGRCSGSPPGIVSAIAATLLSDD